VLYDDRAESAGVKFNDADLIGLPVRLVIGDRLLAAQAVEVRPRLGEAITVERAQAVAAVRNSLTSV
jgi:prolyl-tRNA synthetase